MTLGGAPLVGPPSSIDLAAFPLPGLHEHGEQNDPASRSDPVRDPRRPSAEVEPQLSELAIQLLRERLIEQRPHLQETIDVEPDPRLILLVESQVPVPNLPFELHLAPLHSADAIFPVDGRQAAR